MGKTYERIDGRLRAFIERQPVFFTATAPLAGDGHVNLSPKGRAGTLVVLDELTLAYLDFGGSTAETLAHLREIANRVIDTTSLTVHQLKDQMVHSYGPQGTKGGLTVSPVSFGFKHGVPYDADLVFDVRFLPNPHFVERLRALDGRDPAVEEFVMSFSESRELLARLEGLLKFLLPLYEREGKAYLTVAIGCTGGRHRSVMLVEALRSFLTGLGLGPIVRHRDLDRE